MVTTSCASLSANLASVCKPARGNLGGFFVGSITMHRQKYVYIAGYESGQYTDDGEPILVVYAVKLTWAAADAVVKRNPGTSVFKREASKD